MCRSWPNSQSITPAYAGIYDPQRITSYSKIFLILHTVLLVSQDMKGIRKSGSLGLQKKGQRSECTLNLHLHNHKMQSTCYC